MTNLEQKISNNKRLAVLNARYERLIELNQNHQYTTMVLTKDGLKPNPKAKQYIKLLKKIYEQKVSIWISNRRDNKVSAENLETAKTAIVSITREHLFHLTAPLTLMK